MTIVYSPDGSPRNAKFPLSSETITRSPLLADRRRIVMRRIKRCPPDVTIIPVILFTPPIPVSDGPGGINWAEIGMATNSATRTKNAGDLLSDMMVYSDNFLKKNEALPYLGNASKI